MVIAGRDPRPLALLIAEVIGHLGVQRGLQHGLGDTGQRDKIGAVVVAAYHERVPHLSGTQLVPRPATSNLFSRLTYRLAV